MLLAFSAGSFANRARYPTIDGNICHDAHRRSAWIDGCRWSIQRISVPCRESTACRRDSARPTDLAVFAVVFGACDAPLRVVSCVSRTADESLRFAGAGQPHAGIGAQSAAVATRGSAGSACCHAAGRSGVTVPELSGAWTSVAWFRPEPLAHLSCERFVGRNDRHERANTT